MNGIAIGRRTFVQKYISDPLVGFWAAFFILIFKILPLSVARFLGENLGALLGHIMLRRNRIALVNLKIAFPEKTLAEHQKILRGMWRHFGRVAGEIFHVNQVMQTTRIEGKEYIEKAFQEGKGGIVCSAHMGNWELPFAKAISSEIQLNPVFRTANNPYLNKLLFTRRSGVHIPKGTHGARLIFQVLKKGQFITILCDQKYREGMTIPLWGHPAQTTTAIASLALKFNVPILMARCVYHSGGYYVAKIYPPLKVFHRLSREKSEYEIMSQVNHIYENWIREYPEQWLWIHRRFDKKIYR